MNLQPDLLRDILIWSENNLDGINLISSNNVHIEQYLDNEVQYHISLLVEAGYMNCLDSSGGSSESYLLKRLTLNGHQLLVTMKSDKTWKHVKEYLGKMGLVAIPELVKYIIPIITS